MPIEYKHNQNGAQQQSFRQIITAATSGKYGICELGKKGRVPGRFGLTALGAVNLIKKMIADGALIIVYDDLNCPLITAPQ